MLRNEGCRAISVRHVSTGDDFIYSSGIIFLVPFLATMEAVVLLANDFIMSGTSIQLFRHLEHPNLSIISYFIDSWGNLNYIEKDQIEVQGSSMSCSQESQYCGFPQPLHCWSVHQSSASHNHQCQYGYSIGENSCSSYNCRLWHN